jgi:hypothetical protein
MYDDNFIEEFTDAEVEEKPHRKSSGFRASSIQPSSYQSSEVLRILGVIEFGNYEEVEGIILDHSFMLNHEDLVNSGEIVRIALDRNLIELIFKLEKAGYYIPDDLLIRAIKQGKSVSINALISSRIYNPSTLELELWYLLHKGFFQYAERLKFYEDYLSEYSNTSTKDIQLCAAAMRAALKRNYDDLASKILHICPAAVTAEMVEIAINNDSLEFIRRIWTGHLGDLQKSKMAGKRNKKTPVWKYLRLDISESSKLAASKYLNIGFIVRRLLQRNQVSQAKKVILWPEASDNDEIFTILVEFNQEELARLALKHRSKEITKKDFEFSFQKKKYWVCLDMLRFKSAKIALLDKEFQREIVELLSDGETCYFAAEFLSNTDVKFWNEKLVLVMEELINNNIKKSDSFVKCPFPLLQIVLVCEFLKKISEKSLLFKTACLRLMNDLLKLGKFIQDSITEELQLKHFLYSTDSKDRTVLSIISQNGFYSLLENNDLGSVVACMWTGDRKTVSFLNASTLYKSFKAPSGSTEKLLFLNKSPHKEFFTFQFEQLVTSCKLRFLGQLFSIVLLVYFYTMTLYTTKSSEKIAENSESQGFLRVSQVWIFGIFAERLIQIFFALLTGRQVQKDFWIFNDCCVFALTLAVLLDVDEKLVTGGLGSLVGVRDLNVLIHSIVLCLIWLRFFQVLLTTDNYGPMLMIMFQMASEMIKFLVVFFSAIFIGTVILSLVFHDQTTSEKFDSFGVALYKVYSLSLGSFELADYNNYKAFGAMAEGFLVILLNILMLNVLIATLSVTYEKEQKIQTAKFRSVLIDRFQQWKWDEKYGILILLPAPLSFLSVFIFPVLVFSRDPAKITGVFARGLFIIYVFPFFLVFAAFSLVFVLIVYLTSLRSFATGGIKKMKNKEIFTIKTHNDDSEDDEDSLVVNSHAFSYRRAIVWVLIGWAFAITAYFRDCCHFWVLIFQKTPEELTAQEEMITSKFIQNTCKALKMNSTFIIDFDQFLKTFFNIDDEGLSPLVRNNHQKLAERRKMIEKFFEGFLFSKKNRTIRREFLKAFMVRSEEYSEEFLYRIRFIRVHLVLKALKKFRKNCKEVKIKGVKIPKHVTSFGTFQVKESLNCAKDMMKQQKNTINAFKKLLGIQKGLV